MYSSAEARTSASDAGEIFFYVIASTPMRSNKRHRHCRKSRASSTAVFFEVLSVKKNGKKKHGRIMRKTCYSSVNGGSTRPDRCCSRTVNAVRRPEENEKKRNKIPTISDFSHTLGHMKMRRTSVLPGHPHSSTAVVMDWQTASLQRNNNKARLINEE